MQGLEQDVDVRAGRSPLNSAELLSDVDSLGINSTAAVSPGQSESTAASNSNPYGSIGNGACDKRRRGRQKLSSSCNTQARADQHSPTSSCTAGRSSDVDVASPGFCSHVSRKRGDVVMRLPGCALHVLRDCIAVCVRIAGLPSTASEAGRCKPTFLFLNLNGMDQGLRSLFHRRLEVCFIETDHLHMLIPDTSLTRHGTWAGLSILPIVL